MSGKSAVLPIETERLAMRMYELDDVPRLHAMLYGDAVVRQWTGGPSSLAETRLTVARYIGAQQRDGYAYWAAVERASGRLVGEAGLKPLDDLGPEIELGYAFGLAYHGRGYATEVARAIVDEAFGSMALDRVYATAHTENAASRRVLQKLGFTVTQAPTNRHSDLLYYVLERPGA
jgi:ribosomal-protein-alanine N-acetyltransferase